MDMCCHVWPRSFTLVSYLEYRVLVYFYRKTKLITYYWVVRTTAGSPQPALCFGSIWRGNVLSIEMKTDDNGIGDMQTPNIDPTREIAVVLYFRTSWNRSKWAVLFSPWWYNVRLREGEQHITTFVLSSISERYQPNLLMQGILTLF